MCVSNRLAHGYKIVDEQREGRFARLVGQVCVGLCDAFGKSIPSNVLHRIERGFVVVPVH